MSENKETQASAEETEAALLSRFSEAITKARAAAGLSHETVASELRLEVQVVRALDTADFSALGAPVFVKGHLRAYEKLLRLPPNELVALYEAIHPATDAWRVQSPQQAKVKPANLAQWGLLAVLLLAAIAIVVFLLSGSSEPESSDLNSSGVKRSDLNAAGERAAISPPASAAQSDTDADVIEATLSSADSESGAEDARPAVADSSPASPVVAAANPSGTRISMVFKDDCWVEVSDANGRLLLNTITAGSRREFDGVAPISFVLGDADAVQLSFDGVPYSVPGWSVRNKAARFKLTAADISALKGTDE